MLKNTLKQILAVAALGCMAAAGNAQMRYTAPTYSARMGGSLVAGVNIGYYNNNVISFISGVPRLNFTAPSTGSTQLVTRMPSDGRIVVQAAPGMISSPIGFNNGNTGLVNRMPADGRIVPLAAAGILRVSPVAPSATGLVFRMPSNGNIVIQSRSAIRAR